MPLQPESEILSAYAKIAEDSGLISKEASEEKAKGQELSTIELLYGVKPNGKEYERNIIEKAHPETVVAIPAHDAMDGIIENVNQRQDIMNYIARKTPDGNPIHRRYVAAYEDLTKAIVRAGFKLDNEGDEELMKLADSCAGRLEKKALLPVLWLAGGIATLLGSIAWVNNTADSRQNVIANSDRALAELADLQGKMTVDNIVSDVSDLNAAATSFETIKIEVFTPQSIINAAKTQQKDIKAAESYKQKLIQMSISIPQYITQLDTLQSQDASYDWTQKLKDIARAIIPDDATEAVHALEGLNKAVQQDLKAVALVEEKAKGYAPQIQKQLEQAPAAPTTAPAATDPGALEKLKNEITQTISKFTS